MSELPTGAAKEENLTLFEELRNEFHFKKVFVSLSFWGLLYYYLFLYGSEGGKGNSGDKVMENVFATYLKYYSTVASICGLLFAFGHSMELLGPMTDEKKKKAKKTAAKPTAAAVTASKDKQPAIKDKAAGAGDSTDKQN